MILLMRYTVSISQFNNALLFNDLISLAADERATLALPGSEPAERTPSTHDWRYLSGDHAKPKFSIARGTSSVPVGNGSRAGSRQPAALKLLSEPPTTPLKSSPSPSIITQNPTQKLAPTPLNPSSTSSTTVRSPTQPLATSPSKSSSVPTSTTQNTAQPPTASMVSTIVVESKTGPESHTGGDDIVIEKPTDDRGSQEGDATPSKAMETDSDVIYSVEVKDNDMGSLGDPEDIAMDTDIDLLSDNCDCDVDMVGLGNDGDTGSENQVWDNGEPLTEVEHAHLLTMDEFSRVEEMKRRRRNRLESEGIERLRKEQERDSESATWDNSLPLTAEEREAIMKLPISERAREMNICRTNAIKARAAENCLASKVDNEQ